MISGKFLVGFFSVMALISLSRSQENLTPRNVADSLEEVLTAMHAWVKNKKSSHGEVSRGKIRFDQSSAAGDLISWTPNANCSC